MHLRASLLTLCTLLLGPLPVLAQAPPTPGGHAGHAAHTGGEGYAELMTRDIKALSDDRVEALLAGDGAGYALAAELNRYPGPRHVLDLEEALDLSPAQREAITRISEAMNTEARELGARLVESERRLDRAFRDRSITEPQLEELLREIGELEARIRLSHLRAHLETTALLTHPQIHRYNEVRGYGDGHRPGMPH
jgi:hypothetical protein